MSRIPILCKPLSDIGMNTIEDAEICHNCGSRLFYVIREYGAVKRKDWVNVEVVNVALFCAVCGMQTCGYSLFEEEDVVKWFDSKDDADDYAIALKLREWKKEWDEEQAAKSKKEKKK